MIEPSKIYSAFHDLSEFSSEVIGYFSNKEDARNATFGKGWYSDYGTVREEMAIVEWPWAMLPTQQCKKVLLDAGPFMESATAKLTGEEYFALTGREKP